MSKLNHVSPVKKKSLFSFNNVLKNQHNLRIRRNISANKCTENVSYGKYMIIAVLAILKNALKPGFESLSCIHLYFSL